MFVSSSSSGVRAVTKFSGIPLQASEFPAERKVPEHSLYNL